MSARLTLAVVMALLTGSVVAQPAHGHDHAAMRADPAPGFQADMDAAMARMMQDMHAPGYSGNVDVDFLVMMIPHHAGAIDMARLVLQHGRDPLTRQLAEEMCQDALDRLAPFGDTGQRLAELTRFIVRRQF